jgi:outer membrane protein assembly factor BamD (BamD/ComL family)
VRRLSCRRAEGWLDERALGLELSGPRQTALEDHLNSCPACAEHEALAVGLERAGRTAPLPDLPPLIERRMLAARDPALNTHIPRAPQPRGWVVTAALGAAAAALIALVFTWLAPPAGPAVRGADVVPDPAGAERRAAVVSEAAPAEDRARALGCSAPGTTLWAAGGAEVRVLRNDEQRARFAVERGLVLADIGRNEPGFEFVVETPHLSVLAHGTVFVVEIDDSGRESVRVHEGVVEIRELGSGVDSVRLAAGLQLGWGDEEPTGIAPAAATVDLSIAGLDLADLALRKPATRPELPVIDPAIDPPIDPPPAARPSASELTRRAQSHQRAREYDQARLAYMELIESHPGSVAAQNTRIALGQLELGTGGQPHGALAYFEGYLDEAPDGALAEEARLGRVRALAAAAQHAGVIGAATEFEERHPGSHALAEVIRLRGDAHRLGGQPQEASADYQLVIQRWGGTGQAARAQQQLDTPDPLR